MRVIGLENNYYLSGNDIWIKVNDFASKSEKLEVSVKNTSSQKSLPIFVLYPNPNDDYHFNICLPIRALFPESDHLSSPSNNIQAFELVFKATLNNKRTETTTLKKDFIRGGIEKHRGKNWHLNYLDHLVISQWVKWEGINFDYTPQRIQRGSINNFILRNTRTLNLKTPCNYKIIKFLNSLGGYQYWVFENFEVKTQSKAGKIIPKIQGNLQQDNFRSLGISSEQKITLYTRTPADLQPIITDLIQSIEILMYNENGTDNDSRWQRLVLENNDCLENSFDFAYENKITFSFNNQVTRAL